MTSSPAPGSRLADYFFVAGLGDSSVLETYEAVKQGRRQPTPAADDYYYYQQQQQRAATTTNDVQPSDRFNGNRFTSVPEGLSNSSTAHDAMLEHVKAVIDSFDKERDSARDAVIALHDHNYLKEKYGRERSASESTAFQSSSTTAYHHTNTKWQGGSEPSHHNNARQRQYSEPPPRLSRIDSQRSTLPNRESSAVPNILNITYIPTLLMRYPKEDHEINSPFPLYVAMFCFPRDIKLHYGTKPPPERLHSFAITGENGSTMHGTCIVFYERLSDKLIEPVNKVIREWVEAKMSSSTVEYAQHLKQKVEHEQTKLEQHSAQLASLATFRTTQEIQQQRENLEELVRSARENIALYTELLEPVQMGVCDAATHIWVPKAIGLLGQMPWLELYGDWLRVLLDAVVGVQGRKNEGSSIHVANAVYNMIREVPLPPPGRFEIGLTIHGRALFFSRPPINQVPLLKNFSLLPLFQALSPHLIVAVLETLLAEGKVLFLSNYAGMLSLACESFRYLLFPFYWQFVYIPVLPEKLLTCLQAPVPYIIGFQGGLADVEDYIAEDTCIVNLDSNTMRQSHCAPRLPDRQRRKLQMALEEHAPLHTRYRMPYGVPLTVQEGFPNGRMLLASSKSRVQATFDGTRTQRTSEASDFSTSIWSTTASGLSSRRLSGFWSSNESTRSSNDSSTSLANSSVVDVPAPTMPQYPGVARLASNPLGSISNPSLHTPPISPTTSRNKPQRPAAPTRSDSTSTRHSASEQLRMAEVSQPRPSIQSTVSTYSSISRASDHHRENKTIRRLSGFMSKPLSTLQHNSVVESQDFAHIFEPLQRTHFSSPDMLHEYGGQVVRRVRHMEGHTMTEVFPQELAAFQGYRCLCGKPVPNESEEVRVRQSMFMRCQECNLVTHESCVDQILHACLPACFNERKVQEAFLRMFASLLHNYRTGFVDGAEVHQHGSPKAAALSSNGNYVRSTKKGNVYFSKEKYLKHQDRDTRPYLSQLANSQMFNQFITDRLSKPQQDPEILMFDEFIKLKLNRSKLKFVKEDTPFLNDQSFEVSQTIWAKAPDNAPDKSYDRFPIDIFESDK